MLQQIEISKREVIEACKENVAGVSNKVLYDLCESNFLHKDDSVILAKTLIIGRVYAAAIERVKKKKANKGDFYLTSIIPTFRKSDLDKKLKQLKLKVSLSHQNLPDILEVHSYLTNILHGITELKKRSFVSKYLHFHLPNLFFIYDSRASEALNQYVPKRQIRIQEYNYNSDKEYLSFFLRCLVLRAHIERKFGKLLSPRQLDNLLLEKFNTLNNSDDLLSI